MKLTIVPACHGDYFTVTGVVNYPTATPTKFVYTLGETAGDISDAVTYTFTPTDCSSII